MRGRIFVATCAVLALSAVPAAAAPAEHLVNAQNRLRFEIGGAATGGWQTTSDSPSDANSRALVANVPANGDYFVAYTRKSLHIGKAVGDVQNLSFEFSEASVSGHAGSPRISVQLSNGDVLFLSAAYCNQPLAVSGNSWGRADFTGSTTTSSAPCVFYDNHQVPYSSTATESAMQVYADMHPDVSVVSAYVVLDEAGSYSLDRIALGTGRLYDKSNRMAINCPTEASC